MKFANLSRHERLILLHAVENQIRHLQWRADQPIESGVWENANTLLRQTLRQECEDLKALCAELKQEVVADQNGKN